MPDCPGYGGTQKNTIKIQLTDLEMGFLTKKLYDQLKAVVREVGEELIRQSIMRDYKFKKDENDLTWRTEIPADENFKIKFELVFSVGDVIKAIALKRKKESKIQTKRFLF